LAGFVIFPSGPSLALFRRCWTFYYVVGNENGTSEEEFYMIFLGLILTVFVLVCSVAGRHPVSLGMATVGILLVASAGICSSEGDPPAEDPIISDIHVEVVDFPDPDGEIGGLVRDLLPVRAGDRFNPAIVRESIGTLRNTRRFDAIHVDSSEGDGPFELYFEVTPFPLIKRIRFQHAYPVFESKISKAMTASVGDIFSPGLVPRQAEAIAQLYRDEGFIAPMVDIRPEVDAVDGNVTLHIDVDKGPYFELETLTFSGNDSISDFSLKRHMDIWQSRLGLGTAGRFVKKDLKEDVKSLGQYYYRKKYAEATVRQKVTEDKNNAAIKVEIEIEEGPFYKIDFVGNSGISDRLLEKELVFFTRGNVRGRGERTSLKNLEKHYRDSGYLEAEVRMESELMEVDGRPVRVVRYVIDEGPQSIVRGVQFEGNVSLALDDLKENILTRPPGMFYHGGFSPQRLEDDVRAVKLQYGKMGFLNPEVSSEVKTFEETHAVDVVIHIDEGIQTVVDEVMLTGLTAISREEALEAIALGPGQPFREYMLINDQSVLRSLIAEKGFPHVRVAAEHVLTSDRSGAKLTYRIAEGPLVRLERIHYQGDFRTRKKILDREWEISPGDPFVLRKLTQSQKNLRDLGLFTSVRSRALGFKEEHEEVNLVVDFEERKPYFFEARGGYESDRRLFIDAKVVDRNVGGMNRRGWISGELSEVGYRMSTGLREPRLFGSHVAANIQGYMERHEGFNQNFGTDQAGATIGIDWEPWERVTTGLNVKYEYLNQFRSGSINFAGEIPVEDQLEPRNVLVATPRIEYDSRDSFIWPRKGVFGLGYVDISNGMDNDLDDFLRYRLDLRYFWTPFKGLTFAFISRGGYIDPVNQSGNVPEDQLFFLGGITDVRGFRQNAMLTDAGDDAVGGRESLYGSIEARIGVGPNWEVPIFFDAGWLGGIQNPTVESEGRLAVGTGLRYITPIGPIGILYGYKLDRKPDESAGHFYFSMGYTF
jgi:outer membrane protein insertion porin family